MNKIPYPFTLIRGRLRLIGLPHERIDVIVTQCKMEPSPLKYVEEAVSQEGNIFEKRFQILREYDELRRKREDHINPIVLVLEGASGTGKSMLALDMINNLGATRIISTDTVRQVLRSIYTPKTHSELYCHTYQAHKKRQVGPASLEPSVRGYLAQCEHITPIIRAMIERIVVEGAEAVVEGVHIIPGEISQVSKSIVEVLVNPSPNLHKNMFLTKNSLAGLKTVSADVAERTAEYESTRKIQEYLVKRARENGINVIELCDYDQLEQETCQIILETIREILKSLD
ncbi:MAG: hypothetical protein ACFFF4_01325 [Candidatus Thorarchaeota archaeon]